MPEKPGKNSVILILVAVAFAALMDGVDGSIVNIALPTLANTFNTDTGTVAWITVSYFVMLAGLLLIFARIAKNGAIRKVFFYGMIVFTAASLMCGISDSFPMLLVFRVVQGVGAAMMGAAAPMACVKYLPPKKLGLGLAVLTLGCSIGFAIGPAIGGIIIDTLSWHWIFLINVPIGAVVIPLLWKSLPKDDGYTKGHLDITGGALIFLTILFGVLALERCTYPEDAVMVTVSAILFVIFLTMFITVELRKAEPLLNVRVFKHWKFNSVFITLLIVNMVYMGLLYLMPFYMKICMGFSSSLSGLYLLIPPAITLVFCIPITRWSNRTGRRWFSVAACLALTVACVMMAVAAPQNAVIPLLITVVLMGVTWAFCGGPVATRVVENTSDESREIGSSLMNESIYLGGAIGTALFAMLFTMGAGSAGISFSDLQPEVFTTGFVFAMTVAAVVSAVAILLSYIVKDPERKTDEADD